MTADQAPQPQGAARDSRNLRLRVLAGLILAPLTIGLAYAGGWPWAVLVTLATIGMLVEWLVIVGLSGRVAIISGGAAVLALTGVSAAGGRFDGSLAEIAIGLIVIGGLASGKRGWAATGLFYAAAAQIAAILLRHDASFGFSALLFVLLVVWATDIGGYFAGRGIGGPKLWVRVSPKKTWAGAVGGLLGSLLVAAGFVAAGIGKLSSLLLLGAILSVVSQLGDLFESAVKRHFGVKDSSNIIPGHGGLLDRLDGFVAAIVLAAVIGVIRGGIDGAGRGLMVW